MKLGEKILNYRKKLGLSQEELGEKVGVSRQTVSKWEIGQTIPELEKIILLSKEFGITIDELVQEENKSNEKQKDAEKYNKNIDKFIKLMNYIFIIIVTGISIYLGIILYRCLMFIGFNNKFLEVGIERYDEQGIGYFIENYRVSEYTWEITNNAIETKEELTYYNLGNKYKKLYGNYIDPYRIEYLDYDKNEYYDIDCKNKTYKKIEITQIPFEIISQLTEKNSMLLNEISANYNVRTMKGCFELSTNFDYNIRIINDKFHIDNYKYYEDFVSASVSKWEASLTKEKYEDKLRSTSTSCYIDYGVVNENLIRLPDLTEYIQK